MNRTKTLAIGGLILNTIFGAYAVHLAIAPDGDYVNTWGYVQKVLNLVSIITSWHFAILCIKSLFCEEVVNLKLSAAEMIHDALQAELDRATRNPRIPEVK